MSYKPGVLPGSNSKRKSTSLSDPKSSRRIEPNSHSLQMCRWRQNAVNSSGAILIRQWLMAAAASFSLFYIQLPRPQTLAAHVVLHLAGEADLPLRGNSYWTVNCGSDLPPRTNEYSGVLENRSRLSKSHCTLIMFAPEFSTTVSLTSNR